MRSSESLKSGADVLHAEYGAMQSGSAMQIKLKGFSADSATMQGRRPRQEDRHVKIPDFTKAAKALKMPIDHLGQPCAFFAIYDGHQGILCAEFVANRLHLRLLKKLSDARVVWSDERIREALCEVCEELDSEFLVKHRTVPDGCTVVVALIVGARLFVAWIGDSRCVLGHVNSEGDMKAVSLTEDHRPSLVEEANRVVAAGGIVVNFDGALRVAHEGYEERMREIRRAQANGLGTIGKNPVALAVSRSMGDREFKAITGKPVLISTPDVRIVKLNWSDKLLALMCDGVSDVMRDSEVVSEVERAVVNSETGIRGACGALIQEAYHRGSGDNLTVVLVNLDWGSDCNEVDRGGNLNFGQTLEQPLSAVADSKRRRLHTAAAVNLQKITEYKEAVKRENNHVTEEHMSDADGAEELQQPSAVELED